MIWRNLQFRLPAWSTGFVARGGGWGGSWGGGWEKESQRCYHQRQAADLLDKRFKRKLREANPKTAKSGTGKDEDLPQI